MSNYQTLIVDDDRANLDSLQRILRSDGAEVHAFQDPSEALMKIRTGGVDLVITDLRMPSWNGLELMEAIKLEDPSIEVIVITAYGTVEVAVEAMKKGAYDFITKPLQRVQVLKAVHRALERRRLVSENADLKERLSQSDQGPVRDMVGQSSALSGALALADQAARSRANVLIDGESGTGKGLLAEYLHRTSAQGTGLFVKINCTTIPDNLLEAELFGYEAGAFTGAMKRKKGRVELAEGGTLFLDEIGITPLTFQSKLLRLLQEGEFERLGGMETLSVNTRVISATNTDLKKAVQNGSFREDLYYRLNVIHIHMPPLRERMDDLPLLAARFLADTAKKNSRPVPELSSEALEAFLDYNWPGNIRELQNLIERLVVLNKSGVIRIEDLPSEISGAKFERAILIPVGVPLRKVEKILLDETLRRTKGDKRLAAKLLGIHPRTIYRHLEANEEAVLGEPASEANTMDENSSI